MKTAYVGIDVAKAFHVICVLDGAKRIVRPAFKINNDAQGFELLRDELDRLKAGHDIDLFVVGLESTGSYHVHLTNFLRGCPDLMVVLLNPVQTKHYHRSDLRRASTDKVSAYVIALFLVEKTPKPTVFVPERYQAVEDLAKHLHGLTKQKTIVLNRLRHQLELLWPELERFTKNLSAKQILTLLSVVQTPEQLLSRAPESLHHVTVLGTSYVLRSNFLAALYELARHSQSSAPLSGLEAVVKQLAEQALLLRQQSDQLTIALRQLFEAQTGTDQPLLATIGGVGALTAMVVTSAIGDPARFTRGKKVVAYFGLNPRVRQSGATIRGRGFIQKKGNSLVRYYLFNAVLAMIRNPAHPIAIFYRRLVDKGKAKLVAITACMRKLVGIMFAMLRSNTAFNSNAAH